MRPNFHRIGIFALFLSLSNFKAMAVTSISPHSCPKQFKGTVERIVDSKAPFSDLKKVSLKLKVDSISKGDVESFETIEMIQQGPSAIQVGDQFKIQMRNNLVCGFEKI